MSREFVSLSTNLQRTSSYFLRVKDDDVLNEKTLSLFSYKSKRKTDSIMSQFAASKNVLAGVARPSVRANSNARSRVAKRATVMKVRKRLVVSSRFLSI